MPAEHLLPVYVAMNHLQEKPLIDVAAAVAKRDGYLNMIDIGANIGDTVLLVNSKVKLDHVIAIEGSDRFFPYLKTNAALVETGVDIALEKIYLAEESGRKALLRSEDFGTGSLKEDANGEPILLQTLDELIKEKYPNVSWNLIKLDTDGFDYRILKGATKTVSSPNVDLFFEYDPLTYQSQRLDPGVIFTFLQSLGYKRAVFYNNWGEKMYDGPLDVEGFIAHLIEYNITYHRFHFDVWASKMEK
jgi:FkbM family methyltransferase